MQFVTPRSHKLFPGESDSFFNVAYAYAQKHCDELSRNGKNKDPQSGNRGRYQIWNKVFETSPKWQK